MTLMQKIFRHFGSRAALAYALGIKPSSVYGWKKIPELRAYQIEKLTDGLFKVEDIMAINYSKEKYLL